MDDTSQAMIVETTVTTNGEGNSNNNNDNNNGNNKTGSKTDYRNRLLSLLIAADEQENENRMNVDASTSAASKMDDYYDDDDCLNIDELDQNIMRSNFNFSNRPFATGHSRRHDGGGGARAPCRNADWDTDDDGDGCGGPKRKRLEVKKHRGHNVNSSYVGSGCLNECNKNSEAFNLLRNELLFSNFVGKKTERKSRDKECTSNGKLFLLLFACFIEFAMNFFMKPKKI